MHARFLRDFFLFERTKHGLWLHGNMDTVFGYMVTWTAKMMWNG